MDRVGREEQPRDCRANRDASWWEQLPGHAHDQPGREAVQQDVHQVVPPRLEPAQQVVQPEGHDAQGPVRPVRSIITQRRAPEVVLQQPRPWARGEDVRVRQDRTSATKIETVTSFHGNRAARIVPKITCAIFKLSLSTSPAVIRERALSLTDYPWQTRPVLNMLRRQQYLLITAIRF